MKLNLSPRAKKGVKLGLLAGLLALAYYLYYYFSHRFTDNFQGQAMGEILGIPNSAQRFGGNLGFTTKMKHGLVSGDRINIKQDSGAVYPAYDGDTTVISILDDYNFTVDKAYIGSTPPNPGTWKKL